MNSCWILCDLVFIKSYWWLDVVPWNRLYRINKVSKCHLFLVLSSSILFSAPRALRSLIAVEPSTIETNTHSLEFEFSVPDATQEDRSLATLNLFSHWIKRSLISPASFAGLRWVPTTPPPCTGCWTKPAASSQVYTSTSTGSRRLRWPSVSPLPPKGWWICSSGTSTSSPTPPWWWWSSCTLLGWWTRFIKIYQLSFLENLSKLYL